MTTRQQRQKQVERYWAEEAARALGFDWAIEDSERPDLLVSDGEAVFGLEVTEVHIDADVSRHGSASRARESANQKWIDAVLARATEAAGVPLRLQFLGTPSAEAAQRIIALIKAEEFMNRPVLDPLIVNDVWGKVWAHRSLEPRARVRGDSVGWVSTDPSALQNAIHRKSNKLSDYARSGSDIRLLVVADRRRNSGKLVLPDGFVPQLGGFSAVYFFSAPDDAWAFNEVHQQV